MSDFNDLLNERLKDPAFKTEWDDLDPFYSEQNQARLYKSITEMEATGGTIHDVSDSLIGILSDDGSVDSVRSGELSEKYGVDI